MNEYAAVDACRKRMVAKTKARALRMKMTSRQMRAAMKRHAKALLLRRLDPHSGIVNEAAIQAYEDLLKERG